MFTGIVQDVGTIESLESRQGDLVIGIRPVVLDTNLVQVGDSIAVAGVCLTAVNNELGCLFFDVSKETLSRTLLGSRQSGDGVNLELAMSAQDRFGGHLVSGHVDGLATLIESEASARSTRMRFAGSREVAVYIAEKGSVTLDGVSLTVNGVTDSQAAVMFDVNLVPHTLGVTTLGRLATEDRVHLEVDMVARYLQRMQDCR
jgi:riboflavin synthase